MLIDNAVLTTAYPELECSGGAGSEIKVTYAEALFDVQGQKGNRNEIEGKKILGYEDYFYPEGGQFRQFRPLWFRTYRYVELEITTGNDPIVLHDLKGEFTGYPFEERASFESSDPVLKNIWDVGWRTARLCAGETHYDCPYYEQLSYIGDTRIQCLITLYVSGDDRLMRKSIDDFYVSSIPEGLTQSRYPAYVKQVIPPYSLFWIAMLHDYLMLREDPEFVSGYLEAVKNILSWYESFLMENGMLGEMPWWHFVDWAQEWRWNEESRIGGVPNGTNTANSSILSLQYAYALNKAVELFQYFQDPEQANHYAEIADFVSEGVMRECWDQGKSLIAESPDKKEFSQHANILGILTDAIPESDQTLVLTRITSDQTLIQATFYFQFYLFRAMQKVGMGNNYLEAIEPWKQMIDLGLTTFAERPDPTRSDCHAWSASPVYDLLSIVAGITPDSPGFQTVSIRPHPGGLSNIRASMPHPDGKIRLDLAFEADKVRGSIELPEGISGEFTYFGKDILLEPGGNKINLKK